MLHAYHYYLMKFQATLYFDSTMKVSDALFWFFIGALVKDTIYLRELTRS